MNPIPPHGPARVAFFQKRADALRDSLNGISISAETSDEHLLKIGKVLAQWQAAKAERDRSHALGGLGVLVPNVPSHAEHLSKILFAEA